MAAGGRAAGTPIGTVPAAPPGDEERHRARFEQYDRIAEERAGSGTHRYYGAELRRLLTSLVPDGGRLLEVGCGFGELLHALPARSKIGVDVSVKMIEMGRELHPQLDLRVGDVLGGTLPEGPFDTIVLSDVLGHLDDILQVLDRLRRRLSAEGRLIVTYYNFLWEPVLRLAEALGLKSKWPDQNWLSMKDIENLLYLADFEVFRRGTDILLPAQIPAVSRLANQVLAKLPIAREAALVDYFVARPAPPSTVLTERSVSVICPAKNERGNIREIVRRTPVMGAATELIFVEGNSDDGTREEIVSVMQENSGLLSVRLVDQADGIGKGDAVRRGFAAARHEVLMILDADMTVPPDDLPKFYRALVTRKGDRINGVRLVYPMEDQAMRFLNLLGNRCFSTALSWLLDQPFKDSLCGTKVLTRENYQRIASHRAFFGKLDPFGDFDLLFGAARLNFKIVDLPIRYRARAYGDTKISRFRHGWTLAKMVAFGFRKLKLSSGA